jgi:YgiT-type zinc finger domain-containing protein
MDTTCPFCGGTGFREAHTQYVFEHKVYALVVDDVPCNQCEYCGERYFTKESADLIQKAFMHKYFIVKGRKKR